MGLTIKNAPIKTYLRGNHAPFMSKLLTQNFSHRTKLRNRFLKHPSHFNKAAYKIQCNKCVRILRSEKRRYYGNLNPKLICDNKKFCYIYTVFPLITFNYTQFYSLVSTLVSGVYIFCFLFLLD